MSCDVDVLNSRVAADPDWGAQVHKTAVIDHIWPTVLFPGRRQFLNRMASKCA
jgi:hypothetical protein